MKEELGRIQGKSIVGGKAMGEAAVSNASLGFRSEFDPGTGKVINPRHPLYDRDIGGKVLVMPSTKGSSGNPMAVTTACLENNGPAALVNTYIDSLGALACVVNQIPMVQIDEKDFESIPDGCWLVVDGDNGIIKVYKEKP